MTKQEPFTAVKASCCANYANEKQLVSGQVLLAEDARLVSGYCTSSSAVHSNYTVGTNGPACSSCLWGGAEGPLRGEAAAEPQRDNELGLRRTSSLSQAAAAWTLMREEWRPPHVQEALMVWRGGAGGAGSAGATCCPAPGGAACSSTLQEVSFLSRSTATEATILSDRGRNDEGEGTCFTCWK